NSRCRSQPNRMPRFYRIVKTNPPTEADFLSNQAQGRPSPRSVARDPALLDRWAGISVFETEAQARRRALARPDLGRFIVSVEFGSEEQLRVLSWGDGTGHTTL